MCLAAVGRHHEALLGPEEIDLELLAVDRDPFVYGRLGKRGVPAELQEALLERTVGQRGPGQLTEHLPQDAGPAPRPRALQHLLHRTQVEDLEDLRLLDGALHLPAVHYIAQVDERPGHRGAGDAVHRVHILRAKRFAHVHLHTGPPPCRPRDGDLHLGTVVLPEPEQSGGVAVRNGTVRRVRQGRGRPPALPRPPGAPNRVNAPVHSVQPPTAHPTPNGAPTEAQLPKLPEPHHAMLDRRQRHQAILARLLTKRPPFRRNVRSFGHTRQDGARRVTRGLRL
jgi:hypothetical protein